MSGSRYFLSNAGDRIWGGREKGGDIFRRSAREKPGELNGGKEVF
jgi:hypothetical protein